MDFVLDTGVEALHRREAALTGRFLAGLEGLEGVRLAGPRGTENRAGVISLDFLHMDNAQAAFLLEQDCGILTRCGLHCAPAAHRALGTFPQGTVRFSPGWFTTEAEIDAALAAVRDLAE